MKAQGEALHSVFAGDLIDAPDQHTRRAADEVIAFSARPYWKSVPLRDERALTPCGPAHAEMEVAS